MPKLKNLLFDLVVDYVNLGMKFFTAICFIIGFLAANTFIGQIFDMEDYPIPNAIVQYNDQSVETDKNGFFTIDLDNKTKNESKYISLRIKHVGFEQKYITVDSFDEKLIKINLLKKTIDLNNILITGLRKETYIKNTPVLTHLINPKDFEYTAFTNIKDILEITMPNVQNVVSNHAGTSNNRLKIQGLDNKYILFLIDGVRISGEFAGNLDFNMINLTDIERIEIVEGGMSSLYGSSAIGGVVNIITKKNENPYWINASILNENPMINSKAINFGFNNKKINYSFNLNNQNSDGYDLTPPSQIEIGTQTKTLEHFESQSIKHTIDFNLNNSLDISIFTKNYSNKIFQYENHLLMIFNQEDENYPGYFYESIQNNIPRFEDTSYGFSLNRKTSSNDFKIVFNSEEYKKSNYFFNYNSINCSAVNCNQVNNLTNREFVNALNQNNNLLIQFDSKENNNHYYTFGFELNNNKYSSFNIYKDGTDSCGENAGTPFSDCLVESIFNGADDSKSFNKKAFFAGNQILLNNNNTLSLSLRNVISDNFKNNLVYSFAYLVKENKKRNYNIRFNFSKGFRTPAIKELFYNFQGHNPPIIGNPDLKSTTNNFFSLSFDKRDFDNNASMEIFYNDVTNLIAINSVSNEFNENILQYNNFESVSFRGINFHYERILDNKTSMKFVYNHTNPKSKNNKALELISKNSFRFNLYAKTFIEKLDISLSTKFSSKKFIFDQNNTKIFLDDYYLMDVLAILNFNDLIKMKLGCKNLLNYKDDRRLLEDNYQKDFLTTYDPGRRFIVEIIYNFKGN